MTPFCRGSASACRGRATGRGLSFGETGYYQFIGKTNTLEAVEESLAACSDFDQEDLQSFSAQSASSSSQLVQRVLSLERGRGDDDVTEVFLDVSFFSQHVFCHTLVMPQIARHEFQKIGKRTADEMTLHDFIHVTHQGFKFLKSPRV